MSDLKYFARKSGWVALKIRRQKKLIFSWFWFFTLLGLVCAIGGSMIGFGQWYVGFVFIVLAMIILTFSILKLHCYRLYFYDANVMVKEGVLKRDEINFAFLGVLEVTIKQSFIDRIFRVGDVKINFVGQNGIDEKTITDIANPKKLKKYLESRMAKENEMAKVVI